MTVPVNTAISQKIESCLMGAAAGDALSFPYEGLSPVFTGSLPLEAMRSFRLHRSGRFVEGQVTALTQLTLAVCQAVIDAGGRGAGELTGSYIYPLVRDRLLVAPGEGLLRSVEWWARGFKGTGPEQSVKEQSEPPVHLLPLAFLGEDSGEDMLREFRAAVCCTGHDFPAALAVGAAFLSVLRYVLVTPEVVLGDLVDTGYKAAMGFSGEVAGTIARVPEVIQLVRRDAPCPNPMAGYGKEVVTGFVSFLKSPYEPERALLITQRSAGGFCAAFVCGALSGAFNGEEGFPSGVLEALTVKREIRRAAQRFQANSS